MAGVESTGFVRKLETQCVGEIIAEGRATVDTEYDESPDSVTGALAIIIGSKFAEQWEVLEAIYNSLGPFSSGVSLDRVAKLSRSKRKGASETLLTVTLTGDNGTYDAGEIDLTVDGQSYHFSNRAALTITGGVGTGVFIADTVGPLRVLGGTLGPNVTSFAELSIGRLAEPDPLFRLRRESELADEGTGTVPAIKAALSKLDNVSDVRVYSNRKFVADVAGRPPKSIEAVVLPVDASDAAMQPIAETIWANLPAGIESWGNDSLVVTDEEDNPQDVFFTVATAVSPYMLVSVKIDPGTYPGDDALKQALADFSAGLLTLADGDNLITGAVALGGTIYRSKLSAAAQSVPGVLSVLSVKLTGSLLAGYTAADLILSPRQYLGLSGARGFSLSHITVLAAP